MPLETGTFLQDLDQSNPSGSDDRSQGDNHLRLIKTVLKNTFPNATRAFRFLNTAAAATTTVTVAFPTDQNKVFPVNATGGAVSVNLPNPTTGSTVHEDGFNLTVVKIDSSANAVTIVPSGAQLINGAASLVLSSQWQQVVLVWCKTAAQWLALTPGILTALQLRSAGTLLTMSRTENDTTERIIESVFSGSGAGDKYTRRIVGDGSNGLDRLLEYIGSVKLRELDATFDRHYVPLQLHDGSSVLLSLHQSGYAELVEISAPASPAANTLRLYSKDVSGTTKLAMKDSAGTETVFGSGAADVQTFTASGTWTKPIAGSMARIQVWGAGGSGGQGANPDQGGGGGGGGYNEKIVALSTLGATETVTIGAGGAATSGLGDGNVGGNSSFGSHVLAYGGGGGAGSNASDEGGGGGGGQTSAGATATSTTGGAGGGPRSGNPAVAGGGEGGTEGVVDPDTVAGSSFWGGGGGGYGQGSGGASVFGGGGGGGTSGGGGGSVHGGAGGNGSGVGVAGHAGTAPGGGGSGSSSAASGAGARGQVVVTVW